MDRIQGMGNLEYEDRLAVLKLPSLEYRRARGDMIETFKILRGLYDPVSTSSLCVLSDSITRGHPFKLSKDSFNLSLFGNFFSNRIINNWNALPHNVVLSGTINSFKTALDENWAQYRFKIYFKIKN